MGFEDKYHPASFRKVDFLMESESVRRGKKYTLHEYPNSDVRYVEELGSAPPEFTVRGIVHGADAINQRYRLEIALEKKELGLLVHPIYGKLNVMALDFTVSSDQRNIGVHTFDMKFSQSLENITPTPSAPTASELSGKGKDYRNLIDQKIAEYYNDPSSPYNYNKIIETTRNVLDEVNDKIRVVVDLSSDGAAAFDRSYRSITNGITRIVSSAQDLQDNLSVFYEAAFDAPAFIEQLSAAWDNLLEYPLGLAETAPITREQEERQQNDLTVIEHMKLTALVGSYESKVHKDYDTDDDLTLDRELLNANYRSLFNDTNNQIKELELKSLANDPDIREAMAEIRVTAGKIFDEKEKAVFRITEINPGRISMALTCFRYYGSLDYIDQLIGLNPNVAWANFNEVIKALTL